MCNYAFYMKVKIGHVNCTIIYNLSSALICLQLNENVIDTHYLVTLVKIVGIRNEAVSPINKRGGGERSLSKFWES